MFDKSMFDKSRDSAADTRPEARPGDGALPHQAMPPMPASFALGQVVATPGALHALEAAHITPAQLLARHQLGDWGDLDAHDRAVNRKALVLGYRLLSAYTLPESGEKIWIITEADRSVTTLLLPSEY